MEKVTKVQNLRIPSLIRVSFLLKENKTQKFKKFIIVLVSKSQLFLWVFYCRCWTTINFDNTLPFYGFPPIKETKAVSSKEVQ